MQDATRQQQNALARVYQANTAGEASLAIRQYNQFAYQNGLDQIPDDLASQIVNGASEAEKQRERQAYESVIRRYTAYGSIDAEGQATLNAMREQFRQKWGEDIGSAPIGTTTSERAFGLSQDRMDLERQRFDLEKQKFAWSQSMDVLRMKTTADVGTHGGRAAIADALAKSVDAAVKGFMNGGISAPAVSAAIEAMVRGEQLLGANHPAIRNAYARLKAIGVTPDLVKSFVDGHQMLDDFVNSLGAAMTGQGPVKPMRPPMTGPIGGKG